MSKTYWMIALDQENLEITRAGGFNLLGIDSRNRRKSVRITPEDRILYYVEDLKGFAATSTVISEHFEDNKRIWKHYRKDELFPNRVKVNADIVLETQDYVDARELAPTLEYTKKWPAEFWPLAFFGMLHIIPQRDFNLIEEEMRKVSVAAAKRITEIQEKDVTSAAAASRRRQKKREQTTRRRRRARSKTVSKQQAH